VLVGVNLLHAAFFRHHEPEQVVESLLDAVQVLISFVLIFLILLHSGKDAGLSGAFGVGTGQGPLGGGSLVERNLNRWTIAFAILFAALYVRMIRANVMETLGEDYVRTARAKGAPEKRVLFSHVLRNALLPVVTMLGMDIGIGLGGAIFTETVFNLPGLGQTAVIGISNQDLAIVQGVIVFATVAIIIFNLVVDLLYAWIDPRIRLT